MHVYVLLFLDTDATLQPNHVQINITQSMDLSMIEGFRMYLICMASVIEGNSTYHIDIRWSGEGLRSVWVEQLQVMAEGNWTVRKLHFQPWLDTHAGTYTCHVDVKDTDNSKLTVEKTITLNGMHSKLSI